MGLSISALVKRSTVWGQVGSDCKHSHHILAMKGLKVKCLGRLGISREFIWREVSPLAAGWEWFSPNLKLHERGFLKNTWKALYVSQPLNVWHKLKESKDEKMWPKMQSKGGMGKKLHWELGPWIQTVGQGCLCVLLSELPWKISGGLRLFTSFLEDWRTQLEKAIAGFSGARGGKVSGQFKENMIVCFTKSTV